MSHLRNTTHKNDLINGILGIEIIILQVVNSEACPDMNLAISSPFRILAKLENILGARKGYSFITLMNILSKNKSRLL